MSERVEAWCSSHSQRTHSPIATQIHYNGAPWMQIPPHGARWSYHTMIRSSGERVRCVRYSREAWHSGRGEILVDGEMRRNPNEYTIGVAFQNCGLLEKRGGRFFFEAGQQLIAYPSELPAPIYARLEWDDGRHTVEGFWQPYTDEQILALAAELAEIEQSGFPLAASTLLGHEDTAMPLGRKIDPGPLFPWHEVLPATQTTRLNPRTQGFVYPVIPREGPA